MSNHPMYNEYVEVIDNKSMKVVAKGNLKEYTRNLIVLDTNEGKLKINAKIHHFKGYKPNKLLIYK
ncbi:MAG TPA: hypothetical protein VK094_00460 [Pseudogracilibacillus sp.]|nr:hypothetical protein [Pseudogracilibacillus sp.]